MYSLRGSRDRNPHLTRAAAANTGGGLPNGPRKFSRSKAGIMALLLGALLIGFTIAAIILGSIVAAGILILVADLALMAILRSVFPADSSKIISLSLLPSICSVSLRASVSAKILDRLPVNCDHV